MTVLHVTGRLAAAALPAAQLARLGLPALFATCGLAVLVLAMVCWMLGSDARCERAAKVLTAWRGAPTPLAPTPARVRRWSWRRNA